jgi:hypothetical protein
MKRLTFVPLLNAAALRAFRQWHALFVRGVIVCVVCLSIYEAPYLYRLYHLYKLRQSYMHLVARAIICFDHKNSIDKDLASVRNEIKMYDDNSASMQQFCRQCHCIGALCQDTNIVLQQLSLDAKKITVTLVCKHPDDVSHFIGGVSVQNDFRKADLITMNKCDSADNDCRWRCLVHVHAKQKVLTRR